MKIGILTFHNADNYGAVLQCYALQEYLKSKYSNDDVFVIDYKNKAIEKSYKSIQLRKSFLSNFTQLLNFPRLHKKRKQFSKFRSNYINLSKPCFSDFDIIYYGSDQIWNTTLTNNDLVYFGQNFSGRKIAYAVSDGGELEFSEAINNNLQKFESVLCREESLMNKISKLNLKIPLKTVNDPVFLLSREEWLSISQKPKESGYILAYKIAQRLDFDNQAELLGKKLGKKVIQIVYLKSARKLFYRREKIIEGISPNLFIGYIANADFVITTSFHGTAFSIIFDKPFYVLEFEKRNERIIELLKKHSLLDNYIKNVSAR